MRGTLRQQRSWYRDAGGRRGLPRVVPASTMRPRSRTTISSHSAATTPRSCETNTSVICWRELPEQLDDADAGREVERAHRLVGEQQLRAGDDGAGDGDALALAAGEFVRVAVRGWSGSSPTDVQRRLDHARDGRPAMRSERSGSETMPEHVLARVERGIGVLEHRLHLPPIGAHEGAVARIERDAVEADAAGARPGEAEQQAQQGGLARAGLADQADAGARADGEARRRRAPCGRG